MRFIRLAIALICLSGAIVCGRPPLLISRDSDEMPGNADSGYGRLVGDDYDWRGAAAAGDGSVTFASSAPNLSLFMGETYRVFRRTPPDDTLSEIISESRVDVVKVLSYHSLIVNVYEDNSIRYDTYDVDNVSGQIDTGSIDCSEFKHFYLAGEDRAASMVFAGKSNSTGHFQLFRQDFSFSSLGAGGLHWEAEAGPRAVLADADNDLLFPSITGDGFTLAYHRYPDVFLLSEGETSEDLTADTDNFCTQPVICGDGSRAFYVESILTDRQIVQVELPGREKQVITRAPDGELGNGCSQYPAVSNGGRFIAFRSDAANLAPGFTSNPEGLFQIYVYDAVLETIRPLTTYNVGDQAAACYNPAISPDGKYITFASRSPALVGQENTYCQLFLSERDENFDNLPPVFSGQAVRVDVGDSTTTTTMTIQVSDPEGDEVELRLTSAPDIGSFIAPPTDWFSSTQILSYSADGGGTTSFSLEARDAHGAVTAGTVSIELRDYAQGYLSCRTSNTVNDASFGTYNRIASSGDGRWFAYVEFVGAEGGKVMVLKDTSNGVRYIVNKGNLGVAKKRPWISTDGTMLVFADSATIFRCPISESGPDTALIESVDLDTQLDGFLSTSGNGSRVVFSTGTGLYLWEGDRPLPEQLNPNGTSAAVSDSGLAVAFATADGCVRMLYADGAGDFNLARTVTVADEGAEKSVSELSLSRNGRFLAYLVTNADTTTAVRVVDIETNGEVIADIDRASAPLISVGGKYLYLLKEDSGVVQAYRYDITDATYTLLSHTAEDTPADADCYRGVISADGTVAFFTSDATLAGDTPDRRDVFKVEYVDEPNAAPTPNAAPGSLYVYEDLQDPDPEKYGSSLEITLAASDPNEYDQDLTFSIVGDGPFNGLLESKYAERLPSLLYTPDENFNGPDTFSFRCTDGGGLSSSVADVHITVYPLDDPPALSGLRGQTVSEGQPFDSFDLDDFLIEVDGDDVVYAISGQAKLELSMDAANVVTISVAAHWNGSENITFTATDQTVNQKVASASVTFEALAVDDAPVITDIPDQIITEGEAFVSFDLDDYLIEYDDDDLQWQASGNAQLAVVFDPDSVVTVTTLQNDWLGNETITFTAVDQTQDQKSDSHTVRFSRYASWSMTLKPGWNLISFPLELAPESRKEIMGLALGEIWGFQDGAYSAVDLTMTRGDGGGVLLEVITGRGFWIFYPEDEANRIDLWGETPRVEQVQLEPDSWSLVGPWGSGKACDLSEHDGDLFPAGAVWQWDGGMFRIPPDGRLWRTLGYWMRPPGQEMIPLILELGE